MAVFLRLVPPAPQGKRRKPEDKRVGLLAKYRRGITKYEVGRGKRASSARKEIKSSK